MPERLTEILVDQGALKPEQAEEAIKRQVLQGGALDTSMLELELIDESRLLECIAKAHDRPAASVADVTAPLDESALRAFPEQWAKKHLLAPLMLDRDKNILTLLSPAPADTNLIARLGDLLDLSIHTKLVCEFRVHQRIALLYGRAPSERYQDLIAQHGGSITEPLPAKPPATPKEMRPLTFGEAVTQLRDSHERDDIALTMLRYAIRDMEYAAMLVVQSDRLEGWMALGPNGEEAPKAAVPLTGDSAFKVVLDTQAHYLGPLPSDAQHTQFLNAIDRPHPHAVLIIPVRIKNRTIALLYGENGEHSIPPRLAADLMLFTTHVQSALEALLLRKKAESISELPAPPEAAKADAPEGAVAQIQLSSPEPRPAAIEKVEPETPTYAFIKGKDTGDLYPRPTPEESMTTPDTPSEPSTASIEEPPAEKDPLLQLTQPNPAEPAASVEAPAKPQDQILIEEPPVELSNPHNLETTSLGTSDIDDWEDVELDIDAKSTPDVPLIHLDSPIKPSGAQPISAEPPQPQALRSAEDPTEPLPISEPEEAPKYVLGAFDQAVVAEDESEGLLSELQGSATLVAPPSPAQSAEPPNESISDLDSGEGWEQVHVNTWDDFGSAEGLLRAKASLTEDETVPTPSTPSAPPERLQRSLREDATLPDLSAEAWIRASSETVRPRALPPEVVERSARPAEEAEEPVPLTRPSSGVKRMTVHQVEPSPQYDDFEEPVPLTTRSNSSITAPRALEEVEEPVPLTRPSSTVTHAADPLSATLTDTHQDSLDAEHDDEPQIEELHHAQTLDSDTGQVIAGNPTTPLYADPPDRLVPIPEPSLSQEEQHAVPAQLDQRLRNLLSMLEEPDLNTRRAARDALTGYGPEILGMATERFPGRLELDPFAPNSQLPPFAECGVTLSLLVAFGLASHPHVLERLDGPDPVQRFFATYFYSAVFVPEAISRLLQRLHDEEPRICMLAARTLFCYREHPDFTKVLDHLHGRLRASSLPARRHATYLIGLFKDVTALPKLIEVFEKKERALYDVTEDALAEITKQRFGASAKKWRSWLNKSRSKSRIEWLIDGLSAKDSTLRKSAAEELRAVTGLDMGYHEDAPKKQREDSKKRWLKWWEQEEGRRAVSAASQPEM